MTSSNARSLVVALLALASLPVAADDWQFGGHAKYQAAATLYDADSIFGTGGAVTALDQDANLRLKAERRDGPWDYRIHYELGVLCGDTLAASRFFTPPWGSYGPPSDATRLFDLTGVLHNEGRAAAVQRIDRASVGYAREGFVFRAGRDAVSWGNGLVFQPMDIFNPFSPTAIDKEYKPGDDLLYTQILQQSGSDMQLVFVPRRDAVGGVSADSASLAAKYRQRVRLADVDVLLARHYGETLLGGGGGADWGGAVVRGDLMASATASDTVVSGIANVSYSWMWGGHNLSGYLEYFRNGFGQANRDYSTAGLSANPALLARLARGELYNLGRDYLAGGLTIELTPRWMLSPLGVWNLNDGSGLIQVGASFDWRQNTSLLLGATLPLGPHDTEYGGIPLTTPGQYYRPGTSAYGRVAWYF